MRTTVTIDDDVAQQIRRLMRERGAGFKEVLNDVLRRGLRSQDSLDPYRTPTFAMGARRDLDLEKALALAAAMEDAEVLSELERAR